FKRRRQIGAAVAALEAQNLHAADHACAAVDAHRHVARVGIFLEEVLHWMLPFVVGRRVGSLDSPRAASATKKPMQRRDSSVEENRASAWALADAARAAPR